MSNIKTHEYVFISIFFIENVNKGESVAVISRIYGIVKKKLLGVKNISFKHDTDYF